MSTHQHTKCHKPAKKSKNRGKVLDRISSLPDEILGHILSCLPPNCAVATSLLSKRWRYLFRFTTKLHFDDLYSFGKPKSFKKFMHLFLELHQTPTIKEFGLKCYNAYDTSDLDVWINVAILKDVQELHLDLKSNFDADNSYRKEQRLPFSLFNCKSLQLLKINAAVRLVVPKAVCLPNLKVLDFSALTFDGGKSIGRLLCGLTSLEVLTFVGCKFEAGNGYFCISSLTLKYLTFKLTSFNGTIKIDAPSLQNATFKDLFGDTYFCCADKSLKDESTAIHPSLQRNTFGLVPTYEVPTYLNLASLKLGCRGINRWKDLVDLLCNSPRLETVIFDEGLIYHYKVDEDRRWLKEWFKALKVASLSMHMEVIEVHRYSGNEIELYLLEHLLQNAINLKRLTVYTEARPIWSMMS